MIHCKTVAACHNSGPRSAQEVFDELRTVHSLFVAMSCAFAQKQAPRFKAIFEPVNVNADVKLFDVHFVSDQAGWLAGGKSLAAA